MIGSRFVGKACIPEHLQSFQQKPELFSILINRSFISSMEILTLNEHASLAMNEMIHELAHNYGVLTDSIQEEIIMPFINIVEFYIQKLIQSVRFFNPFKKEVKQEIELLYSIIKETNAILNLESSFRKELLELIRFTISYVAESGGHTTW